MFSGLRLRLTLLTLLTALALLALLGGGVYGLLDYYFQQSTDLALQHRMAQELTRLGATVPGELADANRLWAIQHNYAPPPTPTARPANGEEEESEDHGGASRPPTDGKAEAEAEEEAYDPDLAVIYILPLSSSGQVLRDPAAGPAPFPPDPAALAAALATGHDERTIQPAGGQPVRLLTYRVAGGSGAAALQVGRPLGDQQRALGHLLAVLLGLGAASTLVVGGASGWLAGRSLRPAQQAWDRQQAFVANAGHELRTPLTLMRASAEVAQRHLPPGATEGRELLGDVLQECDHMSRLVEDLLLLSRLDAGRLPLSLTPVPLAGLLADVQRQVGRLAAAHNISVIGDPAGGVARADATRLRQVLLILLDNALRYTPPGGTINLSAVPQGRQVAIQVADTGAGIAPEHLPHLFERFYRADPAHNPNSGGTGLGLAIAQALIQAQHGQIQVTSRPGAGTCVTVLLPGAEEPAPPRAHP
jgi:signal transduction histidine kinase